MARKKIDLYGAAFDPRVDIASEQTEVNADSSNFSMVLQNPPTNTLMRTLGTTENITIDKQGTATIRNEGLEIKIRNFLTVGAGRTSTLKLFVAFVNALTEATVKTKEIEIPLKEYMESRGITDEKEARRQTNEDLDLLMSCSISFRYPKKPKPRKGRKADDLPAYMQDFDDYQIIQHKGIRNGKIALTFSDKIYEMLLSSPVMPYPDLLLRLNDKRNPNSFYFLWRISELKNMNIGENNEDIISVTTLLRASPKMPTYEEVMKKNRDPGRRIMEAFYRDMNALEDAFSYELWHERGRKLTPDEESNLTYSTFAGLMVHIYWNEYPDQTKRLEQKKGGNGQQRRTHKTKSPEK